MVPVEKSTARMAFDDEIGKLDDQWGQGKITEKQYHAEWNQALDRHQAGMRAAEREELAQLSNDCSGNPSAMATTDGRPIVAFEFNRQRDGLAKRAKGSGS